MAMPDTIPVTIPVSPEAAQMLQDAERARRIGQLVSDILRPGSAATDPLAALIAETKAEVRASGLTDADIDAELAAWNAERRL
jgi:hypothetical protein